MAGQKNPPAPVEGADGWKSQQAGGDKGQSTARAYQVMPDLDADEYEALKADITDRGVMVPVEYDEHGHVLDGHHRLRACAELGITDWPSVVRGGLDESGKRRHARTLNLSRRHVSRADRRRLISEEIAEDPDRSDRAIARLLGVDHKTVGSVRREIAGEVPHPDPEPDDEYGEEYIAQLLVGIAEDRRHNADDDERAAWAEAVQLADNVRCWARSPLPNLFWFTLVAQHLYIGSTRLDVWDLFRPWLVAVARQGLLEADDMRERRRIDDELPGEHLARLTIGLWGSDADDDTRSVMFKAMETQITVALAKAEPVLPLMTRAQAETGTHP